MTVTNKEFHAKNGIRVGATTGFLSIDSTNNFTGVNGTLTGALNVTGNVTINTDKFLINASTGNTTVAGDVAVNGGDLTSTALTFNALETTVTTLNVGGAADVNIGGASKTITSRGNFLVASGKTFTASGVTSLTGATSINGANVNVSVAPTGTGVLTISSGALGSINNMSIGATTRSTGAFTTLTANGATTLTAGTTSTTSTTGTLVVTGGVGISENLNVGGNSKVSGTGDVTGNFSVNTNKFVVTAASGNTSVAGTLGVTGDTTLSANLAVNGTTISTTQTTGTVSIFNTGLTGVLNIGGAADVNIGGASKTITSNGNFAIASGKNFTQTGIGTFSTGTGAVSLNGNVTISANNTFAQSGTGTFSTGTGAVSLNGNVTIAAGRTLSASALVTFSGGLTVNGANVNTSFASTGTGSVSITAAGGFTLNPGTLGNIDNTRIGETTRASGKFTTIDSSGAASFASLSLSSALPIASGGTNLTSTGTSNQVLGVAASAGSLEYKTITSGTGIDIIHAAGSITIQSNGVVPNGSATDTFFKVGQRLLVGSLLTAPSTHNGMPLSNTALEVRPGSDMVYDNLFKICTDNAGSTPILTVNTSGNVTLSSTLNNITFTGGAASAITVTAAKTLSVADNVTLNTITTNNLMYGSATGVISSLATANNGVLVTSGSGVPSISTTLPSGLTVGGAAGSITIGTSGNTFVNAAGTGQYRINGTAVLTSTTVLGGSATVVVGSTSATSLSLTTSASANTVTIGSGASTVTINGALTVATGKTFTSDTVAITGGSINSTSIGATTRSTGAFTTLTANGATTLTAGTGSTNSTSGTLVVTGGVGISENLNVGGSFQAATIVPVAGTAYDQVYSFSSSSIALSTTWADTGLSGATLATGSYLVQVMNAAGTDVYTGVMSWHSSNGTSTETDEITLQRAGSTPGTAATAIFLKYARTSAGAPRLQISASGTIAAQIYSIKFRRLI